MPSRARALTDDPRTTVVLLALAVLLTGGGILSIGIVDDDAAASAVTDRSAPVEPGDGRSPDGSGAPSAGSGGGRSVGEEPDAVLAPPGAESPTTTTSSPATEAAEPDPVLTITVPGSYRERVTTTSADGTSDTREESLIVERLGGSGDDVRMRQRRESDGQGSGVTYEMAWRPDGVYLLSTTVGQGGFDIQCEHDPPLLHSPRRLETGVEWQDEDTCEFDTAGGGTIRFRYEARVRGATTITVAGTRVHAWLVDTVTDADVTTAFGDFSQHMEGPLWIDPSRGVTVRSEDDVTVTSGEGQGGGGTQHSRVVRELLSLEPT